MHKLIAIMALLPAVLVGSVHAEPVSAMPVTGQVGGVAVPSAKGVLVAIDAKNATVSARHDGLDVVGLQAGTTTFRVARPAMFRDMQLSRPMYLVVRSAAGAWILEGYRYLDAPDERSPGYRSLPPVSAQK